MSTYLQSLTSHLHDVCLLKGDLKSALVEHDDQFNSPSSVEINFGKFKGKTVSEVAQFDLKYLCWLTRQSWCFPDIQVRLKVFRHEKEK